MGMRRDFRVALNGVELVPRHVTMDAADVTNNRNVTGNWCQSNAGRLYCVMVVTGHLWLKTEM